MHFGIAEGWTVGDMYQESVIASTNPNRVTWASGSINVPGGPQTPDQGGVTIDNNETPGCEGDHLNCYPLKWKTFAEYWEDANVDWQLYQDVDNFDDNPLAWFEQFQDASNSSALYKKGMAYVGLDKFYSDAAEGKLPAISYIIGPAELSEHPPYQPKDGAWLQQKVVDAVVNGKNYDKTALIISYDGSSSLVFDDGDGALLILRRDWWLGRSCGSVPFAQGHRRRVDGSTSNTFGPRPNKR